MITPKHSMDEGIRKIEIVKEFILSIYYLLINLNLYLNEYRSEYYIKIYKVTKEKEPEDKVLRLHKEYHRESLSLTRTRKKTKGLVYINTTYIH